MCRTWDLNPRNKLNKEFTDTRNSSVNFFIYNLLYLIPRYFVNYNHDVR